MGFSLLAVQGGGGSNRSQAPLLLPKSVLGQGLLGLPACQQPARLLGPKQGPPLRDGQGSLSLIKMGIPALLYYALAQP